MTIVDVRVTTLDFGPRERAISNSILTSTHQSLSVLEVFTDEGVTGVSLGGKRALIEGPLKKTIVGEDPLLIERLWERMFRGWRKPAVSGEIFAALGAIDCALWDIAGKVAGQPVFRLLGGFRTEVPAYAAGGYYEEGKDHGGLADEMREYVRMGYRAVKMKIGGRPVREDLRRVEVVRDAIGPEVDLMIDANNAYSPAEAIQFARAAEPFRPRWFEEPVQPADRAGCAEVARALDTPIAAGENETTRWGFRDLIDAHAVDIVQANTAGCGGISEFRRIAAYASAHHLPICPHGTPLLSIHPMAAASNGLLVEVYPLKHAAFHGFMKPLEVTADGALRVPTKPGLGFDFDAERLARERSRQS